MNGHLLDTNVLSELLAPHPNPHVVQRIAGLDDAFLSVIVLQEIAFGVARTPVGRRRSELEAFLDHILRHFSGRILPIREPEALAAAQIEQQRMAQGRRVDLADALIAGTARRHDLVVVTRNVRDYEGVGLTLENPWET